MARPKRVETSPATPAGKAKATCKAKAAAKTSASAPARGSGQAKANQSKKSQVTIDRSTADPEALAMHLENPLKRRKGITCKDAFQKPPPSGQTNIVQTFQKNKDAALQRDADATAAASAQQSTDADDSLED